jgi:protoporphyrinogen oxidase
MAKQEMKYRRMFADPSLRPLNSANSLKQTFSMREGYKVGGSTVNASISHLTRPMQNETSLSYNRQATNFSRLSSSVNLENKRLKKDEESFQQSYFEDSKHGGEVLPQDVISIAVKFPKQAGVNREQVYPINIHKDRDVEDLFNKVASLIHNDYGIEKSKFRLLYKSCPVDIN